MAKLKPVGKDATTTALLDAADFLFGEKGPNAVTIREISGMANVNHALLHRHFGSKAALLDAILDRHLEVIKADVQGAEDLELATRGLLDNLANRPALARIFAHLVLAHRPLGDFVRQAGGTAQLAEVIAAADVVPAEARKCAAVLMSFALGWTLFKELTTYAASCNAPEDELHDTVADLLSALSETIIKRGPTVDRQ
jgi:TetR/AcrR family transcriptional regulator, repressor for neighboring sulfatase